MKITLHSIQDLHDLMALVRGYDAQALAPHGAARIVQMARATIDAGRDESATIRYDTVQPEFSVIGRGPDRPMSEDEIRAAAERAFGEDVTVSAARPATGNEPQTDVPVDSRGIPWHHEVHSPTKSTNKDGTWRALRGVDKDLLAAVETELLAAVPQPEPPAEAPVVTETHPLPAGDAPDGVAPKGDASEVPGLVDLAERAAAAAGDAPDGVNAVLDAGKKFIEAHGVATYNAVKNAVVGDTPTQKLQPADRRLLCAALSLYDPTTP